MSSHCPGIIYIYCVFISNSLETSIRSSIRNKGIEAQLNEGTNEDIFTIVVEINSLADFVCQRKEK